MDARTDIWSLGVLLYETVAGRSPFAAPSGTEVLAAILDREPASMARFEPDTPAELQRILTKSLRKDRVQRYQTVQDLLLDLQALRDEIQSRHTPGPALPPQQPLTREKRRKSAFILGSLLLLVGIAAGVWWVASKRRGTTELPQREPVLTQLTANPMELPVSSVAISPDGRYLAYADPSGIKVRHIDTGETQSIPDTRRMNVYAWTGDSTKVRATACDATLCVGWDISLVGWARHRSGANWPATQFVVAAPVGSRFLRFTDSGLEINLLNDTPPLVIKTAALWLAAWSADGRRVLFSKDGFSLQSIAIDGGPAVTVFTPAQRQRLTDAIELSDHRIIVSMTRPGDRRLSGAGPEVRLWELHTDLAGVAVGPPRRLTEAYDHIQGLSASRDGARLAIVRVAFQSDIYIAEFEPRTGLTASPRRLTLDDRDDTPSSWTPDSSTVIFASSRNGTLDILKQRIDSDVAEPFVVGPRDQTLPRVTSDGKWLLYSEMIQPGESDRIMRVPLTGGEPEPVADIRDGFVHCSFYGRCVVVEAPQLTVSDIDPIRGKGAQLVRLQNTAGGYLLPDGNAFATIAMKDVPPGSVDVSLRNRIRILSFTGAPPRDITVRNAGELMNLACLPSGAGFFSVDGRNLLFITPDGASRVLWSPVGLQPMWAEPAPDGRHLAINVGSGQTNAWMLTDF